MNGYPNTVYMVLFSCFLFAAVNCSGENKNMIAFIGDETQKKDYAVYSEFGIDVSYYNTDILQKEHLDQFLNALKTADVIEISKKEKKTWNKLIQDKKFLQGIKTFLANGGIIFCNYNTSKNGNEFLQSLGIEPLNMVGSDTIRFSNAVPPEPDSPFQHVDTPFRGHSGWKNYPKAFRPILVMEGDRDAAMLLLQDNVLGKGKIIYSNLIDFLLWQKKKEKIRRKKNIELLIKLLFQGKK